MNPLDFHGKRVLVTGGGAGIGRACADAFREAGAQVFIAEIDAERCKDFGEGAIRCDVTRREEVTALAGELTRAAGRLTMALMPPAGDETRRTAIPKRAASRPMTMNPSERDRARPTRGGWASRWFASASCSALMPMPWSDTVIR